MDLKPIKIPEHYNYVAAFLTLACNLKCSYCINHFGKDGFEKKHLTGEEWVRGLNRIISRDDLPLTLQGGEPSLHKDFIYIHKQPEARPPPRHTHQPPVRHREVHKRGRPEAA